MKHSYYGRYNNIELRPLEKGDIENLRKWRNDAESTKFLRKVGYITPEMQEKWFVNYLKDPDIFTFTIIENEKLKRMVGSVSIYNFRGNKAEIGKIQVGDHEAHGLGIGRKAMVIAMKIGFELISISAFDAHVHKDNVPAYKSYLDIGFKVVGSKPSEIGGYEDVIEMECETLKKANQYVKDIEIKK